jgi:hypothetical protein
MQNLGLLGANKHIISIRSAHWDAYSLARLILRNYSQQACAPYMKRYDRKDSAKWFKI